MIAIFCAALNVPQDVEERQRLGVIGECLGARYSLAAELQG